MTDYNSMKADKYAQRQGEMGEFDSQIEHVASELMSELPSWLIDKIEMQCEIVASSEAKRRVMQAIKERSEP